MKVCDVFAWFQSKVGFRSLRENAVLLTRSGPFWRLLMRNPKSETKQKLRFWRILPVLKRRILSLDNYPLKPDVLQCWKGPFLRISGDLLGVIVDGFVSKCDYIAPPRRLIRPGTIVCGRIRRLCTGVFASGRFPGRQERLHVGSGERRWWGCTATAYLGLVAWSRPSRTIHDTLPASSW